MLKGLQERHAFVEQHYPELLWASYRHILETSLIHYNLLMLNKKADPDGRHRKAIEQDIEHNHRNFKRAAEPDRLLSRQLSLFLLHPYCNAGLLGLRKMMRKARILKRPEGLKIVHEQQARREYAVK
ncbi:hypothetical protein [Lentibacillus sp. JNUCC-1]|uniref:hypothetical protein n=1 Tax=Lentibacillus sp. JNUCC-1 TaxID=2654513 RepID=UPI0018D22EEE|nr:hypothetical protein [Lentibacillus sp. JNUCC-1]